MTLVEVMVAATMLLLAMGIIGPLLTSMVRNTNSITDQAEALGTARLALNQLEVDVKGAACVVGPPVATVASDLTLLGRDAAGTSVPIVWSVAGGQLTRTVTVAGQPVTVVEVDGVVGPPTVFGRLDDGRVDVALTILMDDGLTRRSLGAAIGARAPEATCPA
jgi:hypothetical protein